VTNSMLLSRTLVHVLLSITVLGAAACSDTGAVTPNPNNPLIETPSVMGHSGNIDQSAAASLPMREFASSQFKHIFSFDVADGALPFAGLANVSGTLYGTTRLGGTSGCFGGYGTLGCGTVFKVTPSGEGSAIYSFKGPPDGEISFAPLTNVKGILYGTTLKGGNSSCGSSTSGCGTVFKITPSGTETVLHSFAGGNDGETPAWTPLILVNGSLYGVTGLGGKNGGGTLFKVTTSGKESIVYRFKANAPESNPEGLIYSRGAFYGPSVGGGGVYGNDYGSIFKVTMSGKKSTVYIFKGFPDGALPEGQLALLRGTLYGTTFGGGINQCGTWGCGTVFEITAAGKEKVLHSFDYKKKDGVEPYSGLIAAQGTLYGTACCGGPYGGGVVFKVTTSGQETILHAFRSYDRNGTFPYAGLISVNGMLYGTTGFGGQRTGHYKFGHGTVYEVTP
jgi:uncharacterized repeat protein (TIGR03803 family)